MKKLINQKGQSLVILLTYMVIAIIVTTASVALVFNSGMATNKVYFGSNALTIAESGAETAMLKLLRNPDYNGETLSIENGEAQIQVTGTDPKTILSVGTLGNFKRTVQVTVSTTNNSYTITSWNEL